MSALKRYAAFWLAVPLYTAAGAALTRCTADPTWRSMGWNLFLAVLPAAFALWAGGRGLPHAARAGLWVLWLLFLPNSFYLFTDLIYVPAPLRAGGGPGGMRSWAALFFLAAGVVLGAVMGLEAMRLAWVRARARLGRLPAGVCAGAVCALCGFGIYLGRFLRLNSWDVLDPVRLLRKAAAACTLRAFVFSLGAGACILGLFLFYLGLARAVRHTE